MVLGFFAGRLAATAIEAINKIGSVSYGPILGIFLLTTVPRVTPLAANIAVAAGVGTNLILWLFFPNVFWFWWNAIGAVVTVGVGVMLGLVCTGRPRPRATAAEPGSVGSGSLGPAGVGSLDASEPAVSLRPRRFPLRESLVMLTVFVAILALCLSLTAASR
jgi:hypothetical protein